MAYLCVSLPIAILPLRGSKLQEKITLINHHCSVKNVVRGRSAEGTGKERERGGERERERGGERRGGG